MLHALPLLRFHEIDALPLSFDAEKKRRAIFGSSCLARLLTLGPKGFAPFLRRPCEEASEPLSVVRADKSLTVLLETFAETGFGFARIEDRAGAGALASLPDFLGMYQERTISTSLRARDVASPAFAMRKRATLREVFEQMFSRRYRRIFIAGTRNFIWDRSIIEHVFSPAVLKEILDEPANDVLSSPISEVEPTRAKVISPGMSLKEAAQILKAERGQCLVFDDRVVTPWDVIMKPWVLKKLKTL